MMPEEIVSNLFLNLVFPDDTIPNILDRERVIVVTDHTTMTQVTPKPRENIEAASYRMRIPSGVPEILEKSISAGIPNAQIMIIETGTIVVVRISTAVSQFLSLGNRPDLAKL
jgi:hypothetical protein